MPPGRGLSAEVFCPRVRWGSDPRCHLRGGLAQCSSVFGVPGGGAAGFGLGPGLFVARQVAMFVLLATHTHTLSLSLSALAWHPFQAI